MGSYPIIVKPSFPCSLNWNNSWKYHWHLCIIPFYSSMNWIRVLREVETLNVWWKFKVWMGFTVASRLNVRWTAKFAIVSRFVNITTMVLIASVAVVVDSLWELFKGISIRNFNTIMIALLIHRIEKVAKNAALTSAYKLEWKFHLCKKMNQKQVNFRVTHGQY